MEDEKRLQELLIKRFIGTLIIVGITEYVFLLVSDRFVMPVVARVFFPGYEMTEYFSSIAIGMYFFSMIANGLVGLVGSFIPAIARLPVSVALGKFLADKEDSFFAMGSSGVMTQMSFGHKFLFTMFVIMLLAAIALPYIAGAVYFSLTTMREFRKIAAKRMQARKDYERKRNLMISDIAHDLRTPITTISGYAQALCDGLVKEEEKKTYLEAIRSKSVGMNDLIQLLFDYTRLDSEGFELNRKEEDVCELVRECAALLYKDAEDAGMDMEADIPDKEIKLKLDRQQFARVINNLIVNAIKHNKAGSHIGVFVFEDDKHVCIAVADNGELIDKNKAEHLYEPFFMGDESRNSRGGSGLGLSVAKKITDMHGYALKLEQGSAVKRYLLLKDYAKAFIIKL